MISIVTVNYNGFEDTCGLIDSLYSNWNGEYEIVVVDNGSKRNEAIDIKDRYPKVKIVRSEQNLGFAGGNNLGIREAEGEYLLFLNNDTYIRDDSLKYLLEAVNSSNDIAGVSPKIRFSNRLLHIQFAGYTPLTPITLRNRAIGYGQYDRGQYDECKEIPYMHGAAMLIRRSVIEEVGLMPECYFLYYEEYDWSCMMRRAGYKLLYEPRAEIVHKESSTTGKSSPLQIYYITRNRMLFAYRNRQGFQKIASILYQLSVAAPYRSFRYLLRGKVLMICAIIRGVFGFFLMKKR